MTHPENPFETPSPKGIRVVQATLRVVVAIQCWGYAASYLHHQTPFTFLQMLQQGYEFPDDQVVLYHEYSAYFLIACGVVTLFRPMWVLLIPLIVWQTGTAVAAVVVEETPFPYLIPMIEAVRPAVPFALLLIDFWPPRVKPTLAFSLVSIGIIRMASVATFFGHGLLSLSQFQNGGELIEILRLSVHNLTEREFEAAQIQQSLAIIGITEIVLAVSLISSRNRFVALCMILWGLMQAASVTFAFGVKGYDQTMLQFANAGAPLAILIFWMKAFREQKPVILPELENRTE